MTKQLSAIAILLMLNSCASKAAFMDTPKRINDALSDPVRRMRVVSRTSEAMVAAGVAIAIVSTAGLAFIIPALFAGTTASLLWYEWFLEPFGLAGYYWEREPRHDEGEEYIYP